jgi:hypothetical protein
LNFSPNCCNFIYGVLTVGALPTYVPLNLCLPIFLKIQMMVC